MASSTEFAVNTSNEYLSVRDRLLVICASSSTIRTLLFIQKTPYRTNQFENGFLLDPFSQEGFFRHATAPDAKRSEIRCRFHQTCCFLVGPRTIARFSPAGFQDRCRAHEWKAGFHHTR